MLAQISTSAMITSKGLSVICWLFFLFIYIHILINPLPLAAMIMTVIAAIIPIVVRLALPLMLSPRHHPRMSLLLLPVFLTLKVRSTRMA